MRTRRAPTSPDRSLPVAAAVAVLVALSYLSLPTGSLAQASLQVAVAVAAPCLLAVRLVRERRSGTWPWLLLLGGTGLYAVATPVWGLRPILTGQELPFPSALDAVYFASYTLSAAFLVALILCRQRHGGEGRRGAALALLDAGIFAVAMAAVLWPALIGPNLKDPAIDGMAQVVALGYPLLTAVLVGLVVRVAISSGAWTSELWLLLVWAGSELLGDIFYGYLSATGAFASGHPISVTWLVSHVALGALALHPDLLRLTEGEDQIALQGSRLWLPLGAVLLPLTVSLFDASLLLQVVAIAGVLLLVARLRLVSGDLLEQRRLAAELAAASERFEHQALHDGLTGLPNRSLFTEQLERAWAHQQRQGRGLVVAVIDLDGFKAVNDRYGHHAGDELLVEAAQRLRSCVRDSDTLARIGGDEFAIVLNEASFGEAREVTDRIRAELASPMVVRRGAPSVSASIGFAEADGHQRAPAELLQQADLAMYAAKTAGKGRPVTHEPTPGRAAEQLRAEATPSGATSERTHAHEEAAP